jgi:hypothetical protein
LRHAQQRVQRCAALRGIDDRTGKKGIDAVAKVAHPGKIRQRTERPGIQALPAEVE